MSDVKGGKKKGRENLIEYGGLNEAVYPHEARSSSTRPSAARQLMVAVLRCHCELLQRTPHSYPEKVISLFSVKPVNMGLDDSNFGYG